MRHVRSVLASFRGLPQDLPIVFEAACRDLIETLGVSSGSVWFFVEGGRAIECAALLDARDARVLHGARLREIDCPAYFHALIRDRRVVAPDVHNHPATAGLDTYLRQRDVRSLLDHVVSAEGQAIAVLCCEQSGGMRQWSPADEAYLEQLAIALGVAIELQTAAAAIR